MLDVFLTVDMEIWCDGWDDLDGKFARSFDSYVHGRTPSGDYGLKFQVDTLSAHGLKGVYFVEPLFAMRFGTAPLEEIVGIISSGSQEVQLHLHTEWVDESPDPLLGAVYEKRQFLSQFGRSDQSILIALGAELLRSAGGPRPNAFRAGSFGFNVDTLEALAQLGFDFDSSYNACMRGSLSGLVPGVLLNEPLGTGRVFEYPITVFRDGLGRLRPTQLTACSFGEMESLLWKALESGRQAFVILFHNFELLNREKSGPDSVVLKRFIRLCNFLARNRDCFRVRGFNGLKGVSVDAQPSPLVCPAWQTGRRVIEQISRRTFR